MARILLAEDEPPVREFLVRALESHGHQVTAVANGSEALVRLKAASFDLLLSDIAMPVMDGVALALSVGRDLPELPIVLISGYPEQRRRAHNLEALVDDIVSKPIDLRQIGQVVADTLARREA